jgi:hypothetical protein
MGYLSSRIQVRLSLLGALLRVKKNETFRELCFLRLSLGSFGFEPKKLFACSFGTVLQHLNDPRILVKLITRILPFLNVLGLHRFPKKKASFLTCLYGREEFTSNAFYDDPDLKLSKGLHVHYLVTNERTVSITGQKTST